MRVITGRLIETSGDDKACSYLNQLISLAVQRGNATSLFGTQVAPWGFYKLLTNIRDKYNNPPVIITENGYASGVGLDDDERINFYYRYLHAMLDAVDEGSDVKSYSAWSIMDNFEWMEGYTVRLGLYEVDYDSPDRMRTPRKSAFVYKNIVKTHTLDCSYEPEDYSNMTIDEGH